MEEVNEYFQNSFQLVNENNKNVVKSNNNGVDGFMVEDLLDFSHDDDNVANVFENVTGNNNSNESSTLTVVDSSSSGELGGRSFHDVQFSSELCVPYDVLAELEWQLSTFSEESFSSEDLQKLQLISGIKARPGPDRAASDVKPDLNNNPIFNSEVSVPAKARSKRSRAAPGNWTSRLLLSPTESSPEESSDGVLSEQWLPPSVTASSVGKKTLKAVPKKKVYYSPEGGAASPGDGRKCLHCATDKTPQWRTGPMGPKTLCNACGVRYKSGRLMPEYRPAASPTFMLTKHSNSHRKVVELRRQKEVMRAHQPHYIHPPPQQHYHHHHHNPNMIFDVNGSDYLIHHQHVGSDFRQLMSVGDATVAKAS